MDAGQRVTDTLRVLVDRPGSCIRIEHSCSYDELVYGNVV